MTPPADAADPPDDPHTQPVAAGAPPASAGGNCVTHLECAACGRHHDHRELQGLCTGCGKPLWVRYDLAEVGRRLPRSALAGRPESLWRYAELLPVADPAERVTLGEAMTPLLPVPRLGREVGLANLWIKDESRLPTGSFKARGMALAVSMAVALGARRLAAPTAGNAGGALAAYAARAGVEAFVFMPEDTPAINVKECFLAGARTYLVNGLIPDCGRIVREGIERAGWFDLSTLKEPYRIEGKKTMGLELAEQFGWELPDAVLYPTGGGTGLVGMWKAFAELAALGWLESPARPKMLACQSEGCAPIVRAFAAGDEHAPPWENAATAASGIRVPAAIGDFMILDAVRASNGAAVAAPESAIPRWMSAAASLEGISLCPEAAIGLGTVAELLRRGVLRPDERVVLFNTGAAQKYPETVHEDLPRIDLREPVDWARFQG